MYCTLFESGRSLVSESFTGSVSSAVGPACRAVGDVGGGNVRGCESDGDVGNLSWPVQPLSLVWALCGLLLRRRDSCLVFGLDRLLERRSAPAFFRNLDLLRERVFFVPDLPGGSREARPHESVLRWPLPER